MSTKQPESTPIPTRTVDFSEARPVNCPRMQIRLLFIFFLLFFVGCSSSDKFDTSQVEGAFKLAEKYDKDERYEEAVAQFNDVKNKFPYSNYATEAELRVADIEMKRKNYAEAQVAYEVFKELHPRHPRSDYVTYQLGMSLYKQLPSTIDRDLALADRAILYFQEVVRSYPSSPHRAEAQEHLAKTREMLADKMFYIGHFYYKRKHYGSALSRFELLAQRFPETKMAPRALAFASRSALANADRQKAQAFLEELKAKHPQSAELRELQNEVGNDIAK